MSRGHRIYHLLPEAHWEGQRDTGQVALAQLERHGFVHCCTREQIVEIASWWLKDDAPLVALEIDPDRLPRGAVRFERPEGETREYPHVYGPLPRDAIVDAHPIRQAAGGSFELPPALADPPPRFRVDGRFDGRPVHVTWEGGKLVEADPDVLVDIRERVDKREQVKQFLEVTTTASLDAAYDAFSLVAMVLDEVTSYRGDGFDDT